MSVITQGLGSKFYITQGYRFNFADLTRRITIVRVQDLVRQVLTSDTTTYGLRDTTRQVCTQDTVVVKLLDKQRGVTNG
jgi:hypothetical protein